MLHVKNASTVRSGSFREDQEWGVLPSLLDELLPITDGLESSRFALRGAASWDVNAVDCAGKSANQGHPTEFLTWCEGRPDILDEDYWVQPADVVANDGRRPLDLSHVAFVVWAEVVAVIDILVIERRPHPANKEVEPAANMVHEENRPLAASVLHRALLEVMANGKEAVKG